MNSGFSRFPDPYQHRSDVGTATAFLIVLLLIVAVGGILFFGNAWILAPIDPGTLTTSQLSVASAAAAPTSASAARPPASRPTFAAPTPASPLAGIADNPQPSATSTPPSPGQATRTPQAAQTPVPAQPGLAKVGNTGGDGVWLRHTPKMSDHWVAWPDNTALTVLGPEADGDGQHWLQVRDPKGDSGWVPAQYVSR
jgi:hypothetical protein